MRFKGTTYYSENDKYTSFLSGILFLVLKSNIILILYVLIVLCLILLSVSFEN